MSGLRRRIAAALSVFIWTAASGAFAAPVTYTMSGTVSGTLGATPFTNAAITITATGDTTNIPNGCTAPVVCNSLSGVTFSISGVGSGTVTDGLRILVNQSSPGVVALERCCGTTGGDWVDIVDSAFMTYGLNTSIGPVTGTVLIGTPQGTVATTAGVLALTSGPVGFQAVAAAGISPPTIAKQFGATTLTVNGSTSLTFTLQNANVSSLTGVSFSDPLPAGLVVATPNGLAGSCGSGTVTAVAGSGSVSLSGATLAAGASCTFSVSVTGTSAGTKNNTTSAITSVEAGSGGTAFANLNVTSGGTPALSPTTPIPTLQEWALWLLALLILVAASVTFRRRGSD